MPEEGSTSQDGECLVKGLNVFKEYWRDPEATVKAFDDEGFFKTGDIVRFSSEVRTMPV